MTEADSGITRIMPSLSCEEPVLLLAFQSHDDGHAMLDALLHLA